jgi:hypothetical protein
VNHITTTASCDNCHSTLAWKPAKFDHAGITSGCSSCHDGSKATGKPAGHMVTSRDCSVCHAYPTWTPLTFRHTSAEYPGDHRVLLTCLSCHKTNTDQATWPYSTYRPACAGCHANQYKPDPHNKTINNVKYTVSELRNCSGACHVYTDTTMTTISRSRPGPQHRVTSGSFN